MDILVITNGKSVENYSADVWRIKIRSRLIVPRTQLTFNIEENCYYMAITCFLPFTISRLSLVPIVPLVHIFFCLVLGFTRLQITCIMIHVSVILDKELI